MRYPLPRRGILPLAFAALSLLAIHSASAQAALPEGYRLEPSPAALALASMPSIPSTPSTRLPAARADDADSAEALLEAAILFSGAMPDRAEAAKLAGLSMIAEARSLAGGSLGPRELGGLLLDLVHARLRAYNELESRLDAALLDGRYNCVSSSTLYAIAARAAGLDVRGVILPDHAYCFLTIDGQRVDVETTSPGGYGDAAKRRPGGGSETGISTGIRSSAGIESGARGIVALILHNRATLYERSGSWAAALGLAVDAYAYVSGGLRSDGSGDATAWETLAGRVNNAVAALSKAGRYADALLVASGAIAAYGPYPGFMELRKAARTGLLMDSVRKAAPSAALALVDEAEGEIDPLVLERTYAYAYAMLAEEKRKAGDHLGAWNVAAEGASRFPGSKDIAAIARTARANWAKDAHNRFAALFNAGKYAEALAAIEAALSLAPEERLLIDDARAARAAMPDRSGAASP